MKFLKGKGMSLSSYDPDLDNYTPPKTVPFLSPFRYAGGKTWLIPKIRYWLKYNNSVEKFLVEPFAGGGIVALTAANENLVKKIVMVELDDEIAATWKFMLEKEIANLTKRIINFEMNLENAKKEFSSKYQSHENMAFATIVKNRISHGGKMLDQAGYLKNGENGKGLNSRWYPETLNKRIQLISHLRSKITFIHGDGVQICKKFLKRSDALFFIDPPYFKSGKRLYKHSDIQHSELFSIVAGLKGDFLMTYDDSKEIKDLADSFGFEYKFTSMRTALNKKKRELLIGKDLSWLKYTD